MVTVVMDGQLGQSGVKDVVLKMLADGDYKYLCYTATDNMLRQYCDVYNVSQYLGPASVVSEEVLLDFIRDERCRVLVNPDAYVVTFSGWREKFYKWRTTAYLSPKQLQRIWCYDPSYEFNHGDTDILVVSRGGYDLSEVCGVIKPTNSCGIHIPYGILSELQITPRGESRAVIVVSPEAVMSKADSADLSYPTVRKADRVDSYAFEFSMERLLMAVEYSDACKIVVTRSEWNQELPMKIAEATGLEVEVL